MATQLNYNRVERQVLKDSPLNAINAVSGFTKKGINLNIICMVLVAGTLDLIGFFVNEVPFAGIIIIVIADIIFIPWFHFSGIKFTPKIIGSMTVGTGIEAIPILGNLPAITSFVIYSYYSE